MSPEIMTFLRNAAEVAAIRGYRLFLVGGAVRDILLGRPGFDIDLSVEGDAIELARALAESPDNVTLHHRFNTARLKWGEHCIDLARSRQETYPRPGALPTVRPGGIEEDLTRRDFSINAMAVSLNHNDWGQLIDCHAGQSDLERRIIRILHPASFIDDATRIWRAVRYEQRLAFVIEPQTLEILKRDLPMLKTISADRQRYELECVLGEAEPEIVFHHADTLGLLKTLHPALKGDTWLNTACARLRELDVKPPPEAYLALLGWRLSHTEKVEFIAGLRLTRRQCQSLNDSTVIKNEMPVLSSPQTAPSVAASKLRGLGADALLAAMAAVDSKVAHSNLARFAETWRHITPRLTGDDLKLLGIPQGAVIKQLLNELRNQRLDGVITSQEQEVAFVHRWLNEMRKRSVYNYPEIPTPH
ncbi:tRNA nucleotidyltransferase [Dehalogenimonas sp. WBC-2]|nr:tRNA nucleotidyltransferase [Dehalogenimonas sp. WBC-2]